VPDRRAHRRRRRGGDRGMNERGTLEAISSPLPFRTKAEAVYGELRRRILSGVLEPSAPLNQEALAPEFGVSVTPVREAVRRLEAEGLVRFQAHKTVVVAPLSLDELTEIYDIRLTLDPYAASLATIKATDAELSEIEQRARARRDRRRHALAQAAHRRQAGARPHRERSFPDRECASIASSRNASSRRGSRPGTKCSADGSCRQVCVCSSAGRSRGPALTVE